jgi:hypothetical protein
LKDLVNRDALCVKCNQVFVITFEGEDHEIVPQEELNQLSATPTAIPGGPSSSEDDGEGQTISIDFGEKSEESLEVEPEYEADTSLEEVAVDEPMPEADVEPDFELDDSEDPISSTDDSEDFVDLDAEADDSEEDGSDASLDLDDEDDFSLEDEEISLDEESDTDKK